MQDCEKGIVRKIINHKIALVEMTSQGDCNACPGKGSCKLFANGPNTFETQYTGTIKEGDSVYIDFQSDKRIFSSLLIFLVPLLVLVASYFLGNKLTGSEGWSIIFSLSGLGLSFVLIFILLKINKRFQSFYPKIYKRDGQ